jgi:hypothetical protein
MHTPAVETAWPRAWLAIVLARSKPIRNSIDDGRDAAPRFTQGWAACAPYREHAAPLEAMPVCCGSLRQYGTAVIV